MKKILLISTTFLFLPFFNVQAQLHEEFDYLDINNVKISLHSSGDFGRKFEAGSQNQMPINQNSFCGGEQAMWINAITNQGEELESINPTRYEKFSGKPRFYTGPISEKPNLEFINKYNRIWKVSKSEIDNHINNYNTIGYIIPEAIKEWPAHGDENQGEAKNLAPFVDLNGNGSYEPILGDYPKIRGDQALFTIINDKNGAVGFPVKSKLNLEIHIMLYGYSRFDYSFAKNTYFLHYEIYNRSKTNYLNEMNIAQFSFIDIGYWNDNFIGTDVNKNMVFGYNGDNFDETNRGYGLNPPAFGLKLLNNPIYSSYEPKNHSGLTQGRAENAEHRRNNMEGRYNTGELQYYYNNLNIASKFAFPGTTDPNVLYNLTEENLSQAPYDRQHLITTRFYDVAPGDKICLDYAGIFARGPGLNNFEQVDYLKDQATGVQNLYNAANTSCSHPLSVQVPERENNFSSFITDNTLFINCQNIHSQDQNIVLINILGQNVYSNKFSADQSVHAINLNNIKPGPYFVRIQNETIKVIVP